MKLIEKAQRENVELLEGMTQKKSDLAQAEQTASVALQALNDHVGKATKADEAKQSVDSTGGQSSNDPERVGTVLSAIGTLRTALMALPDEVSSKWYDTTEASMMQEMFARTEGCFGDL